MAGQLMLPVRDMGPSACKRGARLHPRPCWRTGMTNELTAVFQLLGACSAGQGLHLQGVRACANATPTAHMQQECPDKLSLVSPADSLTSHQHQLTVHRPDGLQARAEVPMQPGSRPRQDDTLTCLHRRFRSPVAYQLLPHNSDLCLTAAGRRWQQPLPPTHLQP